MQFITETLAAEIRFDTIELIILALSIVNCQKKEM